ncbi:TIR-like protein FxsC [Dactylosporangium sp. NPDC051541]|uniref:TIR-like protein FxsC n=1 Tax=Dactylosporangium sp. NPDC051541 TaxID=3363977 RepID=UPI0037A9B661
MGAPVSSDLYFYLSYARSSPLFDEESAPDPEFWIRRFFDDLAEAVRRHPDRDPALGAGFFDGLLPAGTGVRQATAAALGTAQVLVPLYSPRYFNSSWALNERTSFEQRLQRAGLDAAAAAQHIVPVLWTPLPPWERRPETSAAIAVAAEPPPEGAEAAVYREFGLQMMCRLTAYQAQYGGIVQTLATRIVTAPAARRLSPEASAEPTAPPSVPQRRSGFRLTVSVLAPAPTDWHPYSGLGYALPLADYVAETAERLGMPTRVVAPGTIGTDLPGPLVVLVDGTADAAAARDAFAELPAYAVPIVVPGDGGRAPDGAVAQQLRGRGPTLVASVGQLGREVPKAVLRARNLYSQHVVRNRPQPGQRMSLRPGVATEPPPSVVRPETEEAG